MALVLAAVLGPDRLASPIVFFPTCGFGGVPLATTFGAAGEAAELAEVDVVWRSLSARPGVPEEIPVAALASVEAEGGARTGAGSWSTEAFELPSYVF